MATGFSDIVQLGYVVKDMDAAIEHWVRVLGVGPFFVSKHVPFAEVHYRDEPCDAQICAALASHRGIQIEIIQQTGGGVSAYSDFISEKGGGLHHVCALSDDLAADLAGWQERDVSVLMSGSTAAGIPFAYLDTDPGNQGRVLELVQPSPGLLQFFKKIETAAENWDGATARIVLD